MATSKRIIVVLVVALLSTGTALSAQPQKEPPKISNTRQASCGINITTSRSELSMQKDAIVTLVESPNVFGKAAREVIGSPLEQSTIDGEVNTTIREDNIFNAVRLNISLPDDIDPLAEELLKAIVKNLTTEISNMYKSYVEARKLELSTEEQKLKSAQLELEDSMKKAKASQKISVIELNKTDAPIYEQLEKTVNLSMINPGMTFEEVLNIIKESVKPPLQIQPNWKDLRENAGITQTAPPAELDPLTSVKVSKALDILMAGLSNNLGQIDYIVDDGVIRIATADSLPSKMITVVYDISSLADSIGNIENLTNTIMQTIDSDNWYETSDTGKGMIYPMRNKLVIEQTYKVHLKIQNFLQSLPIEISTEPVAGISVEDLQADKQELARDKRKLDMEIARLEARKKEIEKQIAVINDATPSKIKDDTILAELQKILENQNQSKIQIQREIEMGLRSMSDLPTLEDPISRTKIEIAKRREELGKTLGGEQLTKLNDQLSSIMIDYAEKKADLQVIDTYLGQLDSQISAAASSTDPTIMKIRQAKQAVENTQKRLNEINAKIANLQEPKITVIGLN